MERRGRNQLISALAVGLILLAVPAVSQAIPITSISVSYGATVVACDTTGSCSNKVWDLGVGGVDLGGAFSSLVLTQTAGFNFDTSDFARDLSFVGSPTITVNGIAFTDTGHILNNPGDPGGLVHQEAADWTLVNTLSGLRLWVGYADDAHSDPTCADANHTCLPENPWSGSPGTKFIGNPTVSPFCVRPGTTSCFDAGAIRIEAVPESSTIILLATGLLGVALVSRKRAKALWGRI